MDETADRSTEMTQPIIINLGNQKAGKIKALKKGKGVLWDEVINVVEEVKTKLGEDAAGKVILPVVIIYRTKPKRRRLDKMIFPYLKNLR